jgi:hypothetical protein
MKDSSNHQPTPTPPTPTPTPPRLAVNDKIELPTDFIWLLAEVSNIAPGQAECSQTLSPCPVHTSRHGFNVGWYKERDWFPRSKWDEVCFVDYRDGELSAGFNEKFIDKYRTEYLAIAGLAQSYNATWVDFEDPKGGK